MTSIVLSPSFQSLGTVQLEPESRTMVVANAKIGIVNSPTEMRNGIVGVIFFIRSLYHHRARHIWI